MLRAGKTLRFTPREVEGFRQVGLDFEGREHRTTSTTRWIAGPGRSPVIVLICWTRSPQRWPTRSGCNYHLDSAPCLLPVVLGNLDPVVGDAFEVDQIVLLDIA